MESFNRILAALLVVALLVSVSVSGFPHSIDKPDDKGADGSAGGKGECSREKVCTGSLAKIDINARIGSGICVLDSLTKKLLFFKNKCARNVSACGNKSSKYTDVDSKKCGSS